MKRIYGIYFSPTGNTRKLVRALGQGFQGEYQELDLTHKRDIEPLVLAEEDILILGLPVYGGRIPGFLEESLTRLRGQETKAVCLASYGNRHYDDALLEMADLLEANGFQVGGCGAFLGEHSRTDKLAKDRPNKEDLDRALEFGKILEDKFSKARLEKIDLPGQRPYKERKPKSQVIGPRTSDMCIDCKKCVEACPMEVISRQDPKILLREEACISCCACVKVCPVAAKEFTDPGFLSVVERLEANCSARREIELFY